MDGHEHTFNFEAFHRRGTSPSPGDMNDDEFLTELANMEGDQGPDYERTPPSGCVDLTDEQWREALLKETRFYGELRLLSDPNDVVDKRFRSAPQDGPGPADLCRRFAGDQTALPEAAASQLGLPPGATCGEAMTRICEIDEWASTIEFCLREQAVAEYREEQQRLEAERLRGGRDDAESADWREGGF